LTAKALLVSPHGVLNTLPWAALRHEGGRLFEHLPVAVVPNMAAIPVLASRPPAAAIAALSGDPTDTDLAPGESDGQFGPGLADLAALYGPQRLVAPPVTRDAATLEAFRALLGLEIARGGILHLACHGTFDYIDPAGSGLKIARRRLTAAEIALRPLGYNEVTMAACSTGVRTVKIDDVRLLGDDVLGLPASFLEAGASAVLVSTTATGICASRAFFHHYHQERVRGTGALAAYHTAQKVMLSDGNTHYGIGLA
jgi:CHAT domain-containing protein